METEIIRTIQTFLKKIVREECNGRIPRYDFFSENKDRLKLKLAPVLETLGLEVQDDTAFNSLYTVAVNEYISVNPVEIEPVNSLTGHGQITWLTEERKNQISWNYLNRYITLLRNMNRPERVISDIELTSELIVGKMGDPRSDSSFFKRGLIVGSVQSGKTGNFNAVINRSIDAGYGLIVVLSGIMEDLRGQTQLRVENDVVGEGLVDIFRDKKDKKGVGKVKRFGEQGDSNVHQVISITSYKTDFKKTLADSDFSLNNKNILICKKNHRILGNLIVWLYDYLSENRDKHDIPLLIVDDEADNASLNNRGYRGREEASRINGHIRALLGLFTRKTYLGYTATPFANVLQDRNEQPEGNWDIIVQGRPAPISLEMVDNIFPEDFIFLLNPPSNYIGAKQIFETVFDENIRRIPLVEVVYDNYEAFPEKVVQLPGGITRPFEDGDESCRAASRNDEYPVKLPDSLIDSIKCFILSIALRILRKPGIQSSEFYNPHHSMLIHISRFIPWQNRTGNLVSDYLDEIITRINTELPTDPISIFAEFEQTWNRYFAYLVENIRSYLPDDYIDNFLTPRTFSEIKTVLPESVKNMKVKVLNSSTGDKLEYTVDSYGNGKKYIVIGGNKLSRGFTLEGLTINYFVRKTNYSDTLLQMGRWFGYRPGYLDACRIFTTPESVEKFDSTTRSIEELEIEFRKMERKNKTPREFELRVRTHPGTLRVTRPSIMKNSTEVRWSYQDQLEQTTKFNLDPDKILRSWEEFNHLIAEKYSDFKLAKNTDFYVLETDKYGLFEFMDLKNSFHDYDEIFAQIRQFINLCATRSKLTDWTIGIRRRGAARSISDLNIEHELFEDIELSTRTGPEPHAGFYRDQFIKDKVFSASGKSANIVTRGYDFSLLLDRPIIEEAKLEFIEERIGYYIQQKGMTEAEARSNVETITFPERIFRERMKDTQGLLLIYLIDLKSVFRVNENDSELIEMVVESGFNIDIPLIGYAFGFPPIFPDPGGIYVKGDYDIMDEGEEDSEDEFEIDPDIIETE